MEYIWEILWNIILVCITEENEQEKNNKNEELEKG